MPGFEQNEGTNLKLKSASRLEAERSEILNSGSTQHLKTLFNESFFSVASNPLSSAEARHFGPSIWAASMARTAMQDRVRNTAFCQFF